MLKLLRARMSQGWQYVPDVRKAQTPGYRGLPTVNQTDCESGCQACTDICPTNAIKLDPVQIDLGRCVFCAECASVCPTKKIEFTPEYKMAASSRETLVVRQGRALSPVEVSGEIRKLFGRSLKLRSVSAGGCNGCELEINALTNVNFDIGRFGIDFVASPRHADGLVLSGPISKNMASALDATYQAMPDPKFVIAVGTCAISGGIFDGSPALERSFLERFKPKLYVPGCPPHPLTFINGVLDLLGCP